MDEQTAEQLQSVIEDLRLQEANARLVCLVDKNGQLIVASGHVEEHSQKGPPAYRPGRSDKNQTVRWGLVGDRLILWVVFSGPLNPTDFAEFVRKATARLQPFVGADSPFPVLTDEDTHDLLEDWHG